MIIFTLLFYSSFLLYVTFGIYVLMLNRNSSVNRSFFVLCLSLCLWALGLAMMNCSDSINFVYQWLMVSTFGWCLYPGILINFVLLMRNISVKKIFRIIFMLPGLLFFFYYSTLPAKNLIMTQYGWVYVYPASILSDSIYNIYVISFLSVILLLLFNWKSKAVTLREKKQADLIFVTTFITTILAVCTDIILPICWSKAVPIGILMCPIAIIGMGYSISKYKMLKATLEIESKYILKTMSDPVLYLDQDLMIKEVNDALLNVSGYQEDELINKPVSFLFEKEINIWECLDGNEIQFEKSIYSKDNQEIQCLISGTAVLEATGEYSGFVCIFHDITEKKKIINELELRVNERTAKLTSINQQLQDEILERKRIQDQIHYIAYHDSLTELPNRLFFNERLMKAILQVKRLNRMPAVMYIDLDNFKLINDSLGHQKGDVLLYQAAKRLRDTIPKNCFIARIGGDEFCVLISNVKDTIKLENMLNDINKAFCEPFTIDNHDYYISASIGVAIYPADGEDSGILTKNADIAMYAAKSDGKNTYKLCTDDIKLRFNEKTELRNSLYGALDRSELMVFFQPQIRISDSRIVGLEALMRWNHGNESISPTKFIPIAEETGLINSMGDWLIRQVCSQIKTWEDMGFDNLRVSINLSENQLKKEGFVSSVIKNLDDYQLKADIFEFEITERIIFKDNEDIIRVLNELKDLGFIISIDDFGIDHSSFLNIKNLPVDKVKIDMQFIHGINTNRKDSAIVEAIINLCHNLGLCVVAEGIETNEQLKQLIIRDCDVGQGFYFYDPMTSKQIEAILKGQ